MRNPLHIPDYYSPVNTNESYLTFILYIILPTTLLNVIMIALIRGILIPIATKLPDYYPVTFRGNENSSPADMDVA